MTRVMDGVRRVRVTPPVLAARQAASPEVTMPTATAVEPARFAVGMDGVRRSVRATGPVVAGVDRPAGADSLALAGRQFRLPEWQLSTIGWRRIAMSGAMAATALVVSVGTVHLISTPRSNTAHAESAAVAPIGTASPGPAKASPAAAEPSAAGLQTLLNNFAAANPGKFSIVVKDLSNGSTASVNADQVMESASLYKLFVADQIYHQVDTNTLSLSSAAGGGSGNTIQGCLNMMITISDNTCGRALGSLLNWGAQNPALAAQGYSETDLSTPQQTSARDVALLFEHLYDGTLNSPTSNAAFLDLLKAQTVNDRLPQGLPAGTVIAHKTGNLDDVVHDGGIVYGPKAAYVVVVLSGNWNATGNVPTLFAQLSQQLWTYFEQ